jgi:NAD(P)-dependent dehydrogenase (short-subunit alcohol dehydrogenase family)
LPVARKAALITGAAQGIGAAIARLLVQRGYAVAVADLKKPKTPEDGCLFVRTDVSREASVRACVRAVLRELGRLDALVNNAGIADPHSGPVDKLALSEWNRRIGTNLTGVFLTTKHCVPYLRRSRGAVVNISSTRALQSEPDSEAYAASKGGVVALTHALAVSLGPRVRVNCISPGWIAHQRLRPKDHAQHPAGRAGRDADIAALCAYLLSDDAGFVTGQNFIADGGMTRKMIYED